MLANENRNGETECKKSYYSGKSLRGSNDPHPKRLIMNKGT